MKRAFARWNQVFALAPFLLVVAMCGCTKAKAANAPASQEVLFWHFWGGTDRAVVDDIVAKFNASQTEYAVRAVAMPGNNLDLKLFLSIAGGSPPDVVNQDDPIVADYAIRNAILPLDVMAPADELADAQQQLLPAARALTEYRGRLYGLANGLDIRMLFCNAEMLAAANTSPPQTLADLNRLATTMTPPNHFQPAAMYAFLPDPRRVWSYAAAFDAPLYDVETHRPNLDSPRVRDLFGWLASYSGAYGGDNIARFRKGDQALPGATFPLFSGRYAAVMDGQWRVRELDAGQTKYDVVPFPAPDFGKQHAGWANGNFFIVPRGAKNPRGAWKFMRYWCGLAGDAEAAVDACVAGGWIPTTRGVTEHPRFQAFLKAKPLFAAFVMEAASPYQKPIPAIPGSPFLQDEVVRAAEDVLYGGQNVDRVLARTQARLLALLPPEEEKQP